MTWLDSLTDRQLGEIIGVVDFTILAIVFLLGATVSRKRRKALFLCAAIAGILIGIKLDGGLEWVGPGNCSTIGMPIMLMILAAIGIIFRPAFDWFFNRRKPGNCKNCGYDLRATPDRCPECGAIPEKRP